MITLITMTAQDYEDYLRFAISDYANDKIAAGTWVAQEAMSLAQQSFDELLPQGQQTTQEFLYTIYEETQKVGYIWWHEHNDLTGKSAFIYDFIIFEQFRGKGYGEQTLYVLEEMLKTINYTKIGLHVFGHNKPAIGLYQKVGYSTTDITMVKKIYNS